MRNQIETNRTNIGKIVRVQRRNLGTINSRTLLLEYSTQSAQEMYQFAMSVDKSKLEQYGVSINKIKSITFHGINGGNTVVILPATMVFDGQLNNPDYSVNFVSNMIWAQYTAQNISEIVSKLNAGWIVFELEY